MTSSNTGVVERPEVGLEAMDAEEENEQSEAQTDDRAGKNGSDEQTS
jgi:hypothetical protein